MAGILTLFTWIGASMALFSIAISAQNSLVLGGSPRNVDGTPGFNYAFIKDIKPTTRTSDGRVYRKVWMT